MLELYFSFDIVWINIFEDIFRKYAIIIIFMKIINKLKGNKSLYFPEIIDS